MKNKILRLTACVLTAAMLLAGCGASDGKSSTSEGSTESQEAALADGTYTATFTTDNPMFHINEAYNDKGILTVKDGQMTIHITLVSENIVNLFEGTAEDAQKDGAQLIEPTEDTVNYSDGTTEVVYGFDVPVPYLDQEFDLALLGTKGKWYDHKVKVTDPEEGDSLTDSSADTSSENSDSDSERKYDAYDLEKGSYPIDVQISSDDTDETVSATLKVSEDSMTASGIKVTDSVTLDDVSVENLNEAFSYKSDDGTEYQLTFLSSSLPEGAIKAEASAAHDALTQETLSEDKGTYIISMQITGGSGRMTYLPAAELTVDDDHKGEITFFFGSDTYDYVISGDQKYERLDDSEDTAARIIKEAEKASDDFKADSYKGYSAFTIPFAGFSDGMTILADTVAMSTPHEVEYQITFDENSVYPVE